MLSQTIPALSAPRVSCLDNLSEVLVLLHFHIPLTRLLTLVAGPTCMDGEYQLGALCFWPSQQAATYSEALSMCDVGGDTRPASSSLRSRPWVAPISTTEVRLHTCTVDRRDTPTRTHTHTHAHDTHTRTQQQKINAFFKTYQSVLFFEESGIHTI